MRKVFALVSSVVALGLPLAACGGGGSHTTTNNQPNNQPVSLNTACPPGKSYMGCRQKTFKTLPKLTLTAPPQGLLYPDVSVWQGNVDWPAVKAWQLKNHWHPTAIFKMGEYRADPQAARNATMLHNFGFWYAGYWFIRNTGCPHEADQIIAAGHNYGVKLVVFDSEVQEANGYDACMAPIVRKAGFNVVEYTSPGSNPDKNNPGLDVWVASFGPSHPPCLFTCNVGVAGKQSILAWQFTDGQFGPVVNIPGIGHDDVSVDYGLTKLMFAPTPVPPHPKPKPKPKPGPKPKPRIHCYGPHAQKNTAYCKAVYKKVAALQQAINQLKY